MVKSTNSQTKVFRLILVIIISLLLFQSIVPFLRADDLEDGPLKISTSQKTFTVNIGSNLTIYWNFSVPSHEYAVYWEIKGNGVNKKGWGINANCTTPVISTNNSKWTYNCSGYYAKYHVWSTVSVIGYEELKGRRNDGLDGIYTQKVSSNGIYRWDANGTAICRASGAHNNPQIVSDGAGGAIITWEESDIYTQRINSSGDIIWDLNGNPICTANGIQEYPQIISDGVNNTIITWQDSRDGDYDIYAQKINSSGDIQWNANGTAISTANNSQKFPQLVSDGAGGAIITWQDSRDGDYDIYAQKINSSGGVQWITNGTAICTANNSQELPQLVFNDTNGTIITWHDNRDGEYDIYAQKINSSGDAQWIANGTAICTVSGNQKQPQLVFDATNGTIITWHDRRNGVLDIYAQKVNSSGDFQWIANGTSVCTANGSQEFPQIISDGANSTIITWQDKRSGDFDIYAQKVNSSGDIQWIKNGTAICTANNNQKFPQLVYDGENGTVTTWQDNRNGDYDIYSQKINSAGDIQWRTNGIEICTANGDQLVPQIISNGVGGVIITWVDERFDVDVGDDDGDGNGDGNGDGDGNGTYTEIPGFPLNIFIIIFSIIVIIKIISVHINSKNKKLYRDK